MMWTIEIDSHSCPERKKRGKWGRRKEGREVRKEGGGRKMKERSNEKQLLPV